jgi:hypothetical protein
MASLTCAAFSNITEPGAEDRGHALQQTHVQSAAPRRHLRAGSRYVQHLHDTQPEMVPHQLPQEDELRAMIADLPLTLASFVNEKDYYCATLRVPPEYALPDGPTRMEVRPSAACTTPPSASAASPGARLSPAAHPLCRETS